MFKMFFGGFWMLLSWLAVRPFFSDFYFRVLPKDEKIEYIKEVVQDNSAIYIFVSIFFIIGLFLFLKGLKQVISDIITALNGEEIYGYVVDILPTREYVNNNALFKAQIFAIVKHGKCQMFFEPVGFWGEAKKYNNQYVKLKYCKKDVNILDIADESLVPIDLKNQVDSKFKDKQIENIVSSEKDVVIIDGVKYIRDDKE